MTMKRQWVVTCDTPDCKALLSAPTSWLEWEFGQYVNDQAWYASPNDTKTFCPNHWTLDE